MIAHRVLACAVCLGSAFGDRSYSWPYVGLILMPFVVATAVAGVVVWYSGWRPFRDRSPRSHTETT